MTERPMKEATRQSRDTFGRTSAIGWVPLRLAHLVGGRGGARCTPDEKIGADAQRGWIDCSSTTEGAPGTERGQPDDARPHRSSDHKALV
jgi:hypothetical protein